MSDFSIELAAERIQNRNTRDYFREVYQDYMSGSYRSATVMLWSVVVCDLLFKLEEMRDVYGDTKAASILVEVDGKRMSNPYSPEWESCLLDSVNSSTNLLELGDYESLCDLRLHRHLSAHPVLDQADALYSPTREQVRAYMRTALESVFTKPSILTRKVLDTFTDDVCARTPVLLDESSLHKYLDAKYFKHLTPVVIGQLFRGVWRIAFHAQDTHGEENRKSLCRALCELYGAAPDVCDSAVRDEPAYFSEIGVDDRQLALLSVFLSKHPRAYSILTDQARQPLGGFLDRNLDSFALAWYRDDTVTAHLQDLLDTAKNSAQNLSLEIFSELHSVAVEHSVAILVHRLGIMYYGRSGTYDRCNEVYARAIRPFLGEYSVEAFQELFTAVERNRQTYDRVLAHRDHNEVAAVARERFEKELALDKYPHFYASLQD